MCKLKNDSGGYNTSRNNRLTAFPVKRWISYALSSYLANIVTVAIWYELCNAFDAFFINGMRRRREIVANLQEHSA